MFLTSIFGFSNLSAHSRSFRSRNAENTNEISWKNFSYSRCLRNLSLQQLPNKTMHPLFQDSRLKHNSNNVPFQFIALAPFKPKHHSQSPSLPCHCCKRTHHNFIVPLTAVLEAGLMLIRHVRPAPAINSRKLFTIPLRLQHHHLNWLIQQVHSDNRRYGQEFLSQKKNQSFSISDVLYIFFGNFGLFSKFNWLALLASLKRRLLRLFF